MIGKPTAKIYSSIGIPRNQPITFSLGKSQIWRLIAAWSQIMPRIIARIEMIRIFLWSNSLSLRKRKNTLGNIKKMTAHRVYAGADSRTKYDTTDNIKTNGRKNLVLVN